MDVADALKWADIWGRVPSDPPDGNGLALTVLAAEVRALRGALVCASDVARFACDGWREPLMHEGARIAADAVLRLMAEVAGEEDGEGRIAALVRVVQEQEREACAKVCETMFPHRGFHPALRRASAICAGAVRARSSTISSTD